MHLLFACVPMDETVEVTHGMLRKEGILGEKTVLPLDRIAELLEICLEVNLRTSAAGGNWLPYLCCSSQYARRGIIRSLFDRARKVTTIQGELGR